MKYALLLAMIFGFYGSVASADSFTLERQGRTYTCTSEDPETVPEPESTPRPFPQPQPPRPREPYIISIGCRCEGDISHAELIRVVSWSNGKVDETGFRAWSGGENAMALCQRESYTDPRCRF